MFSECQINELLDYQWAVCIKKKRKNNNKKNNNKTAENMTMKDVGAAFATI